MRLQVFNDDFEVIKLSSDTKIISCINPISYGISTHDLFFKESLQRSEYLILDGVYFSLTHLTKTGKQIKKNSGPDSFAFFMKKMNIEKGKVFFLGSSHNVLAKIKYRCAKEFPYIDIDFYSPPFKKTFSDIDNNLMIEKINNFKPDVLFVGMTCPKQEKWSHEHKSQINAKLICNVGAVFDWFAGTETEINPFWWKYNLAWLKRTIDRPAILKRYPQIGIFFIHYLLNIIGLKKYQYD